MLLAILFSAVLTILFKLFSTWRVNTFHAIVINYFTAVSCAVFSSGQLPYHSGMSGASIVLALFIGTFFIFGFNVLARTVQIYGITIGTLMQKMSVLLTVIYAVLYFNEILGPWKASGILLAVVSIVLVTQRRKADRIKGKVSFRNSLAILPVLTFVSSGFIDSLFLTGQKYGWISGTDIPFIGSLFFTAGMIGILLWMLIPVFRRLPDLRSILAGILLGVPNFYSVYFLLSILDLGWDGSVVFPIFNVGVLLASALAGAILLKEDMPPTRIAGVLLASLAIYFISITV